MQKPGSSRHAQRRKSAQRMKSRARKVYPHDSKARLANHLAACSCPICGNPRRHFSSVTLQEKRVRDEENAELLDL